MVDPAAPVSAQVVGKTFVEQYYHILHKKPELAGRFYKDASRVTRPEEDGTMSTTTTVEAIEAKILSFNYGDSVIDLKHVNAQESFCGGVLVQLTGYLIGKDNFTKNFSQSFFLAPQDTGYFVLNDIFRYTESASYPRNANNYTQGVVAPVTPGQACEIAPVVEKNIPEDAAVLTEESQVKGVHVVKVMEFKHNDVAFSSPVPAPTKPQPKKHEKGPVNNAPTTVVAAEPVASSAKSIQNAERYSVHVKRLQLSVTQAMLEKIFQKFGPINPNGVRVIQSNKELNFGFVDFKVPEAAQKAIKASPIRIDGCNVYVEETRPTTSIGSGVIRNDNMRGTKNYSGDRNYNRGPDVSGSRSDYGYTGSNSHGGALNCDGGNYGGGKNYNAGSDVGGSRSRSDHGHRGGNNRGTRNTPQ